MPFEPRLIDEVTDEPLGSLPDDLAALGQQLADDADWLAARYAPGEPAVTPPLEQRVARWGATAGLSSSVYRTKGSSAGQAGSVTHPAKVFVFRPTIWVASAAVVLLVVGILSVNAWRAGDGFPTGISAWRSPGISQGTSAVIGTSASSSRPPDTPVVSFEELSTSQQEAVLDLWEFHQADAPSLSI